MINWIKSLFEDKKVVKKRKTRVALNEASIERLKNNIDIMSRQDAMSYFDISQQTYYKYKRRFKEEQQND